MSTFSEKTAAEISDICSAYVSALGEASVLPLACLAVMGLCLLAVSARRRALYRPGAGALCAAALVSVIYLAGLLLMYLFSMPTGEALILASLNRYLSTLDLWLVLMTAAVALHRSAPVRRGDVNVFYMEPPRDCALWLCCFSAGFGRVRAASPSVVRSVGPCQSRRSYCRKRHSAGERYILVGMQDGGQGLLYFSVSAGPGVPLSESGGLASGDAILIYDPKPLELVYIEQTILPSGEAPVIYDCR